jgi:hypothetical protein
MHHGSPNERCTGGLLANSSLATKSLFQNILPVSPCGSRFWQDHLSSQCSKSLKISILEIGAEKIVGNHSTLRTHSVSAAIGKQAPSAAGARLHTRTLPGNSQAAPHSVDCRSKVAATTANLASASPWSANSLFQNILPVSPYSSRFCRNRAISQSRKSLEINILDRRAQKEMEKSSPHSRKLNDKASS